MSTNRIRTFTVEGPVLDLFVSDCANCGVIFAMPRDLEQRRREDHRAFYCPNGHNLVFAGPSKAEKDAEAARKQAARLRTLLLAEQDQAEAARREAAEARASEARLRWRVGNGVCPCCQRSFSALAAHVATKHPEFVHHDLDALSTRMREQLATIRTASEEQDAAVLDVIELGVDMRSVRALVRRGLVEQVEPYRIALTEAGWPLAEQAAGDPR